ncbi:MAG: hypothetical protein ACE5PV_13575 [Candidatus Poribacteria bacterium]
MANPSNSALAFESRNPRERGIHGRLFRALRVFRGFLEHDILRLAEKHRDALLSMRAIYIDCGTNDGLIANARALHEKLENLGVKHVYREFPGNHICCVMTSMGDALEVFSKAMAFEPVVGVKPKGKLETT